MLPASARIRHRDDFLAVTRRGRRVRSNGLTLHWALDDPATPAQVGFVVPRAVGGAVVRNRVKRQLRHLLAARLTTLPAGARIVLRADARAASSSRLAAEVDRALAAVAGQGSPR